MQKGRLRVRIKEDGKSLNTEVPNSKTIWMGLGLTFIKGHRLLLKMAEMIPKLQSRQSKGAQQTASAAGGKSQNQGGGKKNRRRWVVSVVFFICCFEVKKLPTRREFPPAWGGRCFCRLLWLGSGGTGSFAQPYLWLVLVLGFGCGPPQVPKLFLEPIWFKSWFTPPPFLSRPCLFTTRVVPIRSYAR